MREIRGTHEAILSHMLQKIIKILVSFAIHKRSSRAEEFLRIAIVTPVNRVIDGASLTCSEKYAGWLHPAPDLLRRVGHPGGAGLQEAKAEFGKAGEQASAHGVHEAPHHGNNG